MSQFPTPGDLRRGIGLLVASVVLIACSDAIVKLMTTRVSVMQIALVQSTVLLLAAPMLAGGIRLRSLARSTNVPLQLLRSICHVASGLLFFTGLRYLPLADIVAVIFVGPLLITVLASVLLGERVDARRWVACVVGFVGALVVVRPGLGGFGTAALYPLGAVVTYALYTICTRKLAPVEPHATMLLYTGLFSVVVLGAASPWFWIAPEATGWAGLAALGLLSGSSTALSIRAYALAPAAILAPYAYVEIVAATVLGFAIFGDVPDAFTVIGAGIIMGSGLYVFHRDRSRKSTTV